MPQFTKGSDDTKDPIIVKHHSFDEDEWVQLKRILDDDTVAACSQKATVNGKLVGKIYMTELILANTIDCRIKDASKEGMPWVPLTKAGVESLSMPFRMWWRDEINMCDGSAAEHSKVEINGVLCDFRKADGSVQ